MQHLQYKVPHSNIKSAGTFVPAVNTFFHKIISYFFSTNPYKNRSPQPITPPRFTPLYRTSSPLITVPKALPWQMNRTFIIVLFLLVLPQNGAYCYYLLVVKLVVKGERLLLRVFTTHNLHIQITYFQHFAQNVLSCYQTHNLQSLCDILHLYILLQI